MSDEMEALRMHAQRVEAMRQSRRRRWLRTAMWLVVAAYVGFVVWVLRRPF